jgi:hypothetical protein
VDEASLAMRSSFANVNNPSSRTFREITSHKQTLATP